MNLNCQITSVARHEPAPRAARLGSSPIRAALLFLFSAFCLLPSAFAAVIQFGPYTNYDGTLITNYDLTVRPVGDPAVDAAGNATAMIGLPKRIHLDNTGVVVTNLQAQNYQITNALGFAQIFGPKGLFFRAPLDSGPQIYLTTQPGVLIPGANYNITLIMTNGVASVTYNTVTNAIGGAPLIQTNLPALTNHFITLLEATNVADAKANNSSNLLYSAFNTQLAIQSALSLTNAFATNASGVSYANGRIYVSTNYDALGAANAMGGNLTNYANTLSNNLYSQITIGGINAITATNIMKTATNGYTPLVFTNVAQVLYTNALPALTNGFVDRSITNGFATQPYAQAVTNGWPWGALYDPAGAATAATNGWPWLTAPIASMVTITNGSSASMIQSAINGMTSRGILNIQPGTYTINTAIQITNSIIIEGNGATFTYSPGLTGFMFDTGTNFGKPLLITDLKFDGGVYSSYSDSSHHLTDTPGQWFPWLNPCYTNRSGLRVESSGGVTVMNCTFYGWPGNGCLAIQKGGTLSAQNTPKFIFRGNRCYTNFIGVFATVAPWDVNGYYNAPFGPASYAPEYALIQQNDCFQNQFGVIASAGNCLVQANMINGNYFGLAAFSGINGQHGNYSVNTINHNHDAIYFEGNGLGGLFQGNVLAANTSITFNAVDAVVFKNNSISQSALNFTNGTTGSILNNTYEFGAIWGSTDPLTGIATNINPKVLVSGNYSTDGTNNDGTLAAILAHGTNAAFTGGFVYTANGTNSSWTRNGSTLTNLTLGSISTNGSTANQIAASVGGVTVWTNAAEVLGVGYTNAFVNIPILNAASNSLAGQTAAKANTNTPALYTPLIANGTYLESYFSNGGWMRSNSAGFNDWFAWATNGTLSQGTGTVAKATWDKFGNVVMNNGTFSGVFSASGNANFGGNFQIQSNVVLSAYASAVGKTNIIYVDSGGNLKTNDLGTFVASIINGGLGSSAALTNAIGTNNPNGLVANQTIYFPTNDPSIQSNWFQISKLNSTNGTAVNLTATNTAIEGNVAFGRDGEATNILAGTNYIYFVGAGTSLVTNGAYIWDSSRNVYTNWINGAIITNNTSAWLLQTNGTTLYSLSGSNPKGTYSHISGSVPDPDSHYTAAINDHMVLLGYFSVTNQQAISNSIVQNVTLGVTNGFLGNTGFYGTNGRLYGVRLLYDSPSPIELNNAGSSFHGAQIDFASGAFGQANTNSASGNGALISGGATN